MRDAEGLFTRYADTAEGSSFKASRSFTRAATSIIGSVVSVRKAFQSLSESSNLADLADIFDLTGEKASALFGVFSTSGGNLREAQESLATFNQRINDALTGKGDEAQTLFRELNVGAHEFAQLDVADRFYKLIDAVQKSESPLGKLNLLMKAVGEDGGKNLSRILPLSAEEIKKVGETAKITNEQLQQSREAFRAFQQIGAAASNIWRKTVATIAPALKIIADFVRDNVDAAYEWINNNIKLSKSITDVAKQFTDWFRNLTPETKQAIGAVLALSTAVIVLTGTLTTLGIVFNLFFGGIGIWTGLIATAIAATGLWVYHVGSLRKAWNQVKRAASDFWEFIKPALPALGALLIVVTGYFAPITAALILLVVYWDEVTDAAEEFYQFIKPTLRETWNLIKLIGFALRDGLVNVWNEIQKQALRAFKAISEFLNLNFAINWDEVKIGLRDFVIFAEYSFSHIEDVADAAWAGIKYGAVLLLDEGLKNIFSLVLVAFASMANGLLFLGVELWKEMGNAAGEFVKWVQVSLKKLLSNTAEAIPKLFDAVNTALRTGDFTKLKQTMSDVWKDITLDAMTQLEKIGKVEFSAGGIKIEGLGKVRDQMEKEWVNARRKTQISFNEFRDKRLLQNQLEDAGDVIFEVFEDLILPGFFRFEQPAAEGGRLAGKAFATEFGKEAKKLDAAIFGSAEALSRIDEYREARDQERASRPSSTFRKADDNLAIIRLLEQIANNTLAEARKAPVEIVPAEVP